MDNEGINKINPLLKDDEIFGVKIGKETIFTYIIGTQANITSNQIIRDLSEPNNNICDVKNMHIWCKLALSKQEINSKHNSILNDSYINYSNIQNLIENGKSNNIDTMSNFNGIIDRIFYAGEIKIDENKNVNINFLSGTFMRDIIDCDNPPQETIICIETFLKNIGAKSVTVDKSCDTYINKKMDKSLLNDYVNTAKIKVGVFSNKNDASNYNNKTLNLAKLESQINVQKRSKFSNKDYIEKLIQQYSELLDNNFNMIEYKLLSGGKKKTKRRGYNKKYKNKYSKKVKLTNI